MRLLFVVHRYGYPGGSEIYVQGMAEESCRRGHSVAVFAGEHRGNMNGVSVTHDPTILGQQWDLVVVHGGDINFGDDHDFAQRRTIHALIGKHLLRRVENFGARDPAGSIAFYPCALSHHYRPTP